ncbi:MAG: anhydro-N-acetylmuramic acid kinase [Halofilum sp. (in: g-proteobacteria)]|nr:anhydro-N-acetylmuramic acid kinase [Halofilum sp. (in: g-proteobacteria)]
MSTSLYVGLMTGTSADGIDACLAAFPENRPVERAHIQRPFDDALRNRILAVCRADASLADAATLDVELADASAAAVTDLLAHAGVAASEVRAIGSHGQTVLHRPQGPAPTTIQLGDPHRIAVLTGIDTVADFRRADIAAGGEGAPLAPAFHAQVFAAADERRAVVNLGGIANVTLLGPGEPVLGFDTGPANALLDSWIGRCRGERFDADGAWAAGGGVNEDLLGRMIAEPWFQRPPPKSTGREHFHAAWLDDHLARMDPPPAPRDVQATLAELTARTVAAGIRHDGATVDRVLVCGGGAYNHDLLARLRRRLDGPAVETTAAYGIEPNHVEPMAFAWLARQRIEEQPGNCPSVTGAHRELILGSLIRAPRPASDGNRV